jgi:uncharacterized repeat protein (TIGR01451 family)
MSARTRKSLVLFWTALFVFSIVLQYANFIVAPAPALAVHADGTFELDGNATDDATAGADWSVLDDGPADPSNDDTADASVFVVDAVPERSFTGGGSKDDLNTSAWAHTTQNVPDKDDIQHAFAALYGDTIYFGADRYSNDGDAQVGFWFFKNGISINADGSFTPVHTVGDLLVVSHFTNGGAVSTIELYQWVGTGGDTNGTLDLIATGQTCTGAPATDVACAVANAGNTASPWPYDPKQGADNVFGANAFFEGGLDLSDVFGGQIPCFTGFLVETRASQSVDATLQDFASGAFDTCASITIVKDAVPNDAQDFAFTTTGTGLSNFSLDDDADATLPNTTVFNGLNPGSYSVTEGVVANWQLTNLVCNDANGVINLAGRSATINLSANEDVTCTFTNTRYGRIIVEKQTQPDGSTQSFEFDPSYGANFNLTDGQQNNSGFLAPGTYSVAEVNIPAGWDLTSAVCSDGSPVNAINLALDETVTCVFTNTQDGRILVDKVTDPSGSAQSFEFDSSWGANFNLTDASALNDSGLLNPGTYSVVELTPAGWDLSSVSCSDGSLNTAIGLDPGETVTCTFNNRQDGRIIVEKQTTPDGSTQSFEFDPSYGANFNLTDGQQNNSGFLDPGTYSVAEVNIPAGWELTGATCSDESPVNAINLGAGETVTCVFSNRQDGQIIVEKQTVPDGSTQSFEFDPSYGANFNLTDGQQNNSGFLDPGTYSVAELTPAGWDLTSAVCSDGSLISSINLGAGETVTCIFTNTQRGHIIVDKVTNPTGDPQLFTFTPSWGANFQLADASALHDSGALVPATYSVSEAVPAGWDLTSATCSDQSPVNAISLQPGETVTCTFTNTKRGTIIVEKQTSPDGADEDFVFTGHAAGTISDGEQIVVSNLIPGVYTSTEADPSPAFDLLGITCDDLNSSGVVGTRTATFNLEPGETVKCTFTNVERGTITIIKNAVPDDAQDFTFSTTGSGLSGFSLDDDANATLSNTRTFSNVVAGSYSVTEGAVAGWDLTNLVCNGSGGASGVAAGATANITMTAGGSVLCTFTNSKPAIQVVKTAGTAADGAEFVTPPGNVTYTYVVTNTGPVALSNVKVRDDNGTPANTADDFDATCPKTTLAAGESMTCTATVAVPATANRTNIATATGTSAGGTNVSDTDSAVVRAPLLTVTKGVTGNTGGSAPNGDPEAKIGDTLTYTLTYDLSFGPVTNGVITDKLPAGVTYVTGSATGNAQFTFDSYNATTRTLTWKAATVSVDGSVTYKVTVDAGANALAQPLVNTATIDSDQTDKDDDTQNVFVETPPQAATATPVRTLPPTDTFDTGGSQGNPGFSLMLILLAMGGFVLAVGFITPVPERVRRRDRRG